MRVWFFLPILVLPTLAFAQNTHSGLWEKPAFALSAKELLAAAEDLPKTGDAEAVVLSDDRQLQITAGQLTVLRYHVIYRVNTPGGVRNWDSLAVHWEPWHENAPVIRARVITPDGAIHELDPKTIVDNSGRSRQEFSDSHVTRAPLPAVEVGAIVEKEIVVRERIPAFAGGLVRRFPFNSSAPTEHARLVLEAPSSIPLRYSVKLLGAITPVKTENDGSERLVFELGHRDAAKDGPPYLPYEMPDQPYISVSTAESWAAVASGYSAIVERQLHANDLAAVARRAAAGKTGRDAIAAALLAELHKQVRYTAVELGEASIVPREPAETLSRKYGDCKDQASLLVALLRAANIPAHVALLSSGDDHDVDDDQPGFGQFNHAIVYLPASGGGPETWIDPTDEFARFGEIPLGDQGRMALVARPETVGLLKIPEAPSSMNRTVETREFFLAETGKARVVETTETFGSVERSFRPSYRDADPQQRAKDLRGYVKSAYFSDDEPKIEFSDPADLSKPFRVHLEFQKAGRGFTDSTSAVVGVPLSELLSRLPGVFSEPEKPDDKPRTGDFLLPEAFVTEWNYRIVAPPGFRPAALPESGEQKIGPAVLTRAYARAGDVVNATFRFDTVKRRLTPAEFGAMNKAVRELHGASLPIIQFEQTGQALLTAGDVRGALAEFRKLVLLHPKEALHHTQVAQTLLAAGAGDAARREARAATELDPKSADAFIALGWILQHDLVGRRFKKGCDLAASEQAYRKMKELDPDNSLARADLAIVLEHTPNGVRYESKAHLIKAIEEYKAIQDKLKGNLEHNLLFVLFYAGRYEELKQRTASDHTPIGEQFYLAAMAAAASGQAAVTEASRRIATVQARQTALGGAAQLLLNANHYQQAADVLEPMAGTGSAAQLSNLVSYLRAAVKAAQPRPGPPVPEDTLKRLIQALVSGDAKRVEQDLGSAMRPKASEFRNGAAVGFARARHELSKSGMAVTAAIDMALAIMQVTTDGDDATGYRLKGEIGGQKIQAYLVKEDGAYRMRALEDLPALGEEALRLIENGELAAARRWLDWAREAEQLTGGEDALSGTAFPRLWNKNRPPDAARMRVAAAALMARQDEGGKAIAILKPAREGAQADAERLALDIALTEGYAHQRNGAELLAITLRLRDSYPDSDSAFISHIMALQMLKRDDELTRLIDDRIKHLPEDTVAYSIGAGMASSEGNLPRAIELLKKLVAMGKGNAGTLNELSWNYLVEGKSLDEAVEVGRRAVTASGATPGFAELHTLACAYAETGKTTEARQIILQAMESAGMEEPNEAAWYVFGRIAEQFALTDTARDYYGRLQRPKTDDPTSTWSLAQRRLAVLKQGP